MCAITRVQRLAKLSYLSKVKKNNSRGLEYMRKGITPVIAIVLLLLITVGAVGVVWTQFQNLTGDPSDDFSQQQQVRNTELSYSSVFNNDTGQTAPSGDSINITLRNTGEVTLNVTEDLEIAFVPEDSDSGLAFDVYPAPVQAESDCFKTQPDENEQIEPSESYTCKTGIAWPDPADNVGIEVSLQYADKSWSYSCSPTTSSSVTC